MTIADSPDVAAQAVALPAARAGFPYANYRSHPDQFVAAQIRMSVSPPRGNKWTSMPGLTFAKHTGDGDELTFAGTLWPGEAAWRLRVEFSRAAGFDPEETWTVRGIAVTGSDGGPGLG